MGKRRVWVFYTKTYSTKRICWQRWHSSSKWNRKRKRRREAFERNLWSSCSYKSPEIPTQTHSVYDDGFSRSSVHTQAKKHTYSPNPHKHMYTTHTPQSVILSWNASEMRQRGRGGGGSRFTRPVPAPVSNFIHQPQWCSTAVTHTHFLRHTHFDVFFCQM